MKRRAPQVPNPRPPSRRRAPLAAGALVLLSSTTLPVAASAKGPARHPNSERYAERAPSAATARAGAAELTASALYSWSHGTTEVAFVAGPAEGAPTGAVTRAKVKLLDAAGEAVWTDNQNHVEPAPRIALTYDNLRRGQQLALQAHLAGARGHTEVVKVRVPVLLRPDLAVAAITLPARVRTGAPVNINALVREKNGDVGARADCVLSVDGVAVDRAPGIWVDGGGAVSCAFTQQFSSVGTRAIKVAVAGAAPADDDPVNDERQVNLEVVDDAPVYYSASVHHREFSSHAKDEGGYRSEYEHLDYSRVDDRQGMQESVYVSFTRGIGMARPFDLEVSEGPAATTTTMARQGWMPEIAWGDAACGGNYGWLYDETSAAWLYLSTNVCNGVSWTAGSYERRAGDVTYFSTGFNTYWWPSDGTGSHWSWNHGDRTVEGRALVPVDANQHTIRIRVTDEAATTTAEAVVPLTPFASESAEPYACVSEDWGSYTSRTCHESSASERGVSGTAEHAPPQP